MNFLSITGPKADIDRVVNTYLCKYEIHLENALRADHSRKSDAFPGCQPLQRCLKFHQYHL